MLTTIWSLDLGIEMRRPPCKAGWHCWGTPTTHPKCSLETVKAAGARDERPCQRCPAVQHRTRKPEDCIDLSTLLDEIKATYEAIDAWELLQNMSPITQAFSTWASDHPDSGYRT